MARRLSVQHSIMGASALVAAVGVGAYLILPHDSEPEAAQTYPVEHYEPVVEFAPLPVILPDHDAPSDELALTSAGHLPPAPNWYEASEPAAQLEAFPPLAEDNQEQDRIAMLPALPDHADTSNDLNPNVSQLDPADDVCQYNDFHVARVDDRETRSVLITDPIEGVNPGPSRDAFSSEAPAASSEASDTTPQEELNFGSPDEPLEQIARSSEWIAPAPPVAGDVTSAAEQQFDLPPPVANPIDERQIAIRAGHLIDEGVDRFERRMLASAKTRFLRSLRIVSQSLDAQTRDNRHSVALSEGIRAMKEAEDFSIAGDVNVAMLVASHRTPILKQAGDRVKHMTPMAATQAYFQFAQQRMADACGKQPVASRALFAWGKAEITDKQQNGGNTLSETKAMALYQTALMVDSRNQRAANELGVALARFGQLASARDVLRHSVLTDPTRESWQNLSEVHARLGEHEMANLARQEIKLLALNNSAPPQPDTSVQWLTPQQFAGGQAPMPGSQPQVAREPVRQAAPWWMPWRR